MWSNRKTGKTHSNFGENRCRLKGKWAGMQPKWFKSKHHLWIKIWCQKLNDTGFWFTNSRSHPKAFFGLKCSLSLIKIVYTEMNVSYLRYEDLLYQILFLCNKTFWIGKNLPKRRMRKSNSFPFWCSLLIVNHFY